MWTTKTKKIDGETFDFDIYNPSSDASDLLIVHHGASRTLYKSGSKSIAEREDLDVFAPTFSRSDYDNDAYQRGGIVDDRRNVQPEDEWTTRLEEPMIEWARSQVDDDAKVYLFGHSGGAQYLNRVAAYERPQDVDRIIIANPSTLVVPSLAEDAPYGFDGLGTDAEERQALKEYLALPMTIYLGSEDDDSSDRSMSTGSAAMRQGDNRLERGINTFEMGQDVAEENGWQFNWDLVIAEGVGHSGSAMMRAPEMQEALQPDPDPAAVAAAKNAAPRDIALKGASVDDDATGGTVVGQLSARDADGDQLTFKVAGDPRFTVNGSDQLVVKRGADLDVQGDRDVKLTLSASDGRGGVVEKDAVVTINDADARATETVGEAGRVTFRQENGSQWRKVEFAETLDNPSVVMGGLTFNGSDAGMLRVRNVTDKGFEFQLDEWGYLDGRHKTETASWIAVEQGEHVLSNGMVIAAGSANASGSKSRIDLGGDFDASPAVLAQVTSDNSRHAVAERIEDVRSSGFSVRLDRDESQAKGSHGRESLDWIAIESGGSAGSGIVAGRTGEVVSHTRHRIDFGDDFSSDEFAFLADMQTRDGTDPANVRLSRSDAGSATVFVHEEMSRDREIYHKSEDVGFVGIDLGLISADTIF